MEQCAYCGKDITGDGIIAVGSSKDDPGVKFYHPGCPRRRLRQRIDSATPANLPAESGRG